MHIIHIHDMVEKLSECAKCELDKGIEQIDTKEMGEVAEIIKELCEAEYYAKISKAMDEEDYEEYGGMDEGRKGYRGQPRDSMGRYTSRRVRGRSRRGYDDPMMMYEDWDNMEYMRDMDRPMGRMGYSGSSGGTSGGSQSGQSSGGISGGSYGGGQMGYAEGGRGSQGGRDSREGKSGMMRKSYMESKEMHTENTAEDKQKKMKDLERYMTELSADVTEMISGASPEEKNLLKTKLNTLAQKVV